MNFKVRMLGMVCKFLFWSEEKLKKKLACSDFIFSLNELDFEINSGQISDFFNTLDTYLPLVAKIFNSE